MKLIIILIITVIKILNIPKTKYKANFNTGFILSTILKFKQFVMGGSQIRPWSCNIFFLSVPVESAYLQLTSIWGCRRSSLTMYTCPSSAARYSGVRPCFPFIFTCKKNQCCGSARYLSEFGSPHPTFQKVLFQILD
jgi:hypothetical protein